MAKLTANRDSPTTWDRCVEVLLLFLRLGATAFGGPAAHISMMEEEVVRRRKWMTHGEFLDLLGATNLIPGPNSTEMAIHIGFVRAGWAGLLIAGAAFILPAALIVMALAWAYVRFGDLPKAAGLLYGIKPIVIAIVVQAIWKLGRPTIRTLWLAALAVGAFIFLAFGAPELTVLVTAGLLAGSEKWAETPKPRAVVSLASMLLIGTLLFVGSLAITRWGASSSASNPFSLTTLFLYFLKVGSVLFGSGYVLIAFLRTDLVAYWHWLTATQLLDAIAVGQMTPGPVFTAATFIGYLLGGPAGAAVATFGIFLPAFVFVSLSGPLIPRLRSSVTAGGFLDGVNAASLALMALVVWQLGRAALVDPLAICLALASVAMLVRTRVNSLWLLLAGGVIGLLVHGA